MLSLRMPYAPSRRSDCLASHSWRRNPLLRRRGAFPNSGARVAVARRWTVRAQAPPLRSSPPAGEGASKGLAEGWHRTRGAAVGAAVVLACALGVTCLKRGGRAYCLDHPPSTNGPVDSNEKQGGGGNPHSGGITPGQQPYTQVESLEVLSAIFGSKHAVAMEPTELLELVVRRVGDQVRSVSDVSKGSANLSMLRLLVDHLADQVALLKCWRFEGSERIRSLCKEWSKSKNRDLGYVLIQILINQGDYAEAKKILDACDKPDSMFDPAPNLFRAIIETMLAVQEKLKPETTKALDMAKVARLWEEYDAVSRGSRERPVTQEASEVKSTGNVSAK